MITDCASHSHGRTKNSFETQNCVKATSLNHLKKLLNGLDAGTIQAGLDLLTLGHPHLEPLQ